MSTRTDQHVDGVMDSELLTEHAARAYTIMPMVWCIG